MERFICIHGHFYQPPRENPWLEAVELQDSAYPYHDWNERITAECYAPSTASRILDGDGRISRICNNYARMSFNFGPTLLRWLEEKSPEAYRGILEADRESMARFSGHGSALAQPYNHAILPLMNRRDRVTQVRWGLRDFESRFGRVPEGLWLPEAAVDLETLEILAEHRIAFTVLAPHQAQGIRPLADGADWQDVSGGRIDPTRAYRQKLPSGKAIDIFFYDGPVSRAVAFEKLLSNGERFASRILSAFNETREWDQLVHIATDGETYGHHHTMGDMALSYALEHIDTNKLAKVTNYGEYLASHPPTHEVSIIENSSWSCVHGIERWRSDCGCNSGGPGWHQKWRAPLRRALDGLRDRIAPLFEEKAATLLENPWAARDDYIEVILDRSPGSYDRFLAKHARHTLGEQERVMALKLLELQRRTQLMYTSCGWFFDEISGIETVQVIQYAGCAIQVAEEIFGEGLEGPFLETLEGAPSNLPEHANGRVCYEKFVKPAFVDLQRVAAHYAVSSLFETYPERTKVYSFQVERRDGRVLTAGKAKLALGWIHLSSELTGESADLCYGTLHLGDHNITGGIRSYHGFEGYSSMVADVAAAFAKADLPEVIRRLDKDFLELNYSLRSLFREEQRKILNLVLRSSLSDADAVYRQLYEHQAPLLRFLVDLSIPLPKPFLEAAGMVLNSSLRRALESEPLDLERIRTLVDEAKQTRIALDVEGLSYVLKTTLERMIEAYAKDPTEERALSLCAIMDLARETKLSTNLWKVQNVYWKLLEKADPSLAASPDFQRLGATLGIRAAA